MLNLFCGREALDKEAFLFSKIKESLEAVRAGETNAKRILLIVPAQFTLKAEEAALSHLQAKGFFDLHIMSGNRLRSRILSEVGQTGKTAINSMGRNMLLRKIAAEKKSDLHTFSNVAHTDEFLSMAGDFIVQLKQNNLNPQNLKNIASHAGEREILKKKLEDMHTIYTAYQELMQGKFNDSEDMLKAVCERVQKSHFIATSEIWYYDFYSFVPSEIDFMRELIKYSANLNVVLTNGNSRDQDQLLFSPAVRSINSLKKAAEDLNIDCSITAVDEAFKYDKKPGALAHVEAQLYSMPCDIFYAKDEPLPLHVLRAGTPYTESETIASQIQTLVREHHYSYDDIAVFTNDIAVRGAILGRIFSLNDIPFFIDEKRTLLHNPLIKTITSLLNIVSDHFKTEDVLQFLKGGLVLPAADVEDFENYVLRYHIKNNRFLTPFKYGSKALGKEKMLSLEKARLQLERTISPFRENLLNASSVKDKSAVLYNFLAKTLKIPDLLTEQSLKLAEAGMVEAAEEAQQVWAIFLELLDQMVELLGNEDIGISDYRNILEASFSDIKVGLLPQSEHKVLIGTVGRSRIPAVKALFIAGVNDGILPTDPSEEGILTERELSLLEKQGFTLSKNGMRKQEEERLTIYKAFSRPSQELYLSYSVADAEGKEIRPSSLIAQILSMFPDLAEEPDIENADSEAGFIQSKRMAASRLSDSLRRVISGEEEMLSPLLQQSYNVLLDMNEERLQMIKKGLFFTNQKAPLPPQTTVSLYCNEEEEFSFSPSRLERFAGCPFMHYVSYGLRPEEQKSFGISGSEIGDIHHECLMHLSRDLSAEAKDAGLYATHPDSPWMTITKAECDQRMSKIVQTMMQENFEGLLQAGEEEKYRTKRVAEVSGKFAWKMIEHVRKGSIDQILAEVSFGKGPLCTLPAIEIDAGTNRVSIEGKIDRVDFLNTDKDNLYVKIIDYKSGNVVFRKDKIEKGLSLQLMIYLEGALGCKENAKPAGMFYYHIEDPLLEASLKDVAADSISEDMLKAIEKKYQMDGLFINESAVVRGIDNTIAEGGKSTVITVENKDKEYVSSKSMTSEEFEEFRTSFKEALRTLCKNLLGGSIAVEPRRLDKNTTACTYCPYSSICFFDTSLPDCNYK